MDPLAPLTLVALASGYFFTTRFHLTSYQAERHSGYHVLFQSACWGIVLLVISQLVLVAETQLWPEPASPVYWMNPTLRGSGPFLLAFVLSLLLPYLINGLYSKERAAKRVIRRQGSELEKLLYDAQASLYAVSISLKNEKVYIGWPIYMPDPMRRLQDVRILPAASGSRDPVTKELTVYTEYFPVYERIKNGMLEMDPKDFEIAIALDEIRSANQFSFDIDQDLFRSGEADGDSVRTRS